VTNTIQNDSIELISEKKALFLIWVLLIFLTGSLEFSMLQDIRSYHDNILEFSSRSEGISNTQSKGIFYILFAMPLYQLFGSVELVLLVVKFTIVTIFFFAFTLNSKNLKEVMLFSVLFLIMPTFQEHYQEFLRQGLAIAFLFLGFSLKNIIPKIVLVILSLALHEVVIMPLSAVLIYHLMYARLNNVSIFLIAIFMVICSVCIAFTFYLKGGALNDSVSQIQFLSGNRYNLFGYLYIFSYMIVLGYFLIKSPQAYIFSAFSIACVFCALYPVIVDFGRYLSVISLVQFYAISSSYKKPIHLDIILASIFTIGPSVIY